jgi:hypothetical protein
MYSLTVTGIKEFMDSLQVDDDIEINNREVKKFLRDHYGDKYGFVVVTKHTNLK